MTGFAASVLIIIGLICALTGGAGIDQSRRARKMEHWEKDNFVVAFFFAAIGLFLLIYGIIIVVKG